ncbi:hypothetical protein ACFX2H_039099 [Malus domestica]
MRHQSTVDFSAIEAESFKTLKLEPSEHYAAWGEDLVLALRPGEIIPSERLRDTETGIGPGGRYLWLRAQRLRCRHWAGRLRMKAHNPGIKILPQRHLQVLSG